MSLNVLDAVKRGLGAGAIAGVIYGAYLGIVQTPLIEYMEELAHHGDGHGHDHGHEHLVGETAALIGGIGGGILWGLLLGAAFGVAYYLFEPALPGGRLRAYVLAGFGFVTVSGAPWLVLPPAAPGVDQALSTDVRLVLYGGLMIVGALVCVTSVLAYRATQSRSTRRLALTAGVTPVALLIVAGVLAPTYGTTGAPADLIATFQATALVGQLSLWLLLAAAFVRLPAVGRTGRTTLDVEPAD